MSIEIPAKAQTWVQNLLSKQINQVSQLSGGCIAESFVITCEDSQYVLKINPHEQMTLAESDGLRTLSLCQNDYVRVPQLFGAEGAFLLMEYIPSQRCSKRGALEKALAQIHSKTEKDFGYIHDNYIGKNPQVNAVGDRWDVFYWDNRLYSQLKMAKERGLILDEQKLKNLKEQVLKILGADYVVPSLLHGDLWEGNYFWDGERVVLIDPAIYFGDWQADFSLLSLFAGVDLESIESYCTFRQVAFDSESFLRKRPIYELYHALNHLNLFGHGYLQTSARLIDQILRP